MFEFLLVFLGLIFLLVLHELSHFLAAKKCGVLVEEFGIGLPPRIFGKRIGQTLYSLNLLPLGAFVKVEGEMGEGSFSKAPLFHRMIIVLAGVISFWVISSLIFIFLFKFGIPSVILDEEVSQTAKVQIIQVAKNSPAEIAKLQVGDVIKEFRVEDKVFKIERVKDMQELTQRYKGNVVFLTIERGKKTFDVKIVPRTQAPQGEGPLGIALVRIDIKRYPLWQSIVEGIKTTVKLTFEVIRGIFISIKNLFEGKQPPAELVGPLGIFNIMYQTSQLGFLYFLYLLAVISINLAVFNSLPIPALDGGKFLFLVIEGLRKKPINPEFEKKITALSFLFLLILVLFITIKDVKQIFF
jgi:regulator of sigma E protease